MLQIIEQLVKGQDIFYRPQRGCARIFGPDARDFLQRMSTGDMGKLSPHNPVGTCFITNKGRMVEHGAVFAIGTNDFVIVTSAENPKLLLDWLSGFHFVEDLTFTDCTALASIIITAHPEKVGMPALSLGHLDVGLRCEILLALDVPDISFITDEAWQTLRIMALLPDFPAEINEHHMPDTINLGQFIAEDKGCYIGQEVIAKARTYQKHKKTLCGAVMSLVDWQGLVCGSTIFGPLGQECVVTSRAPLYVLDQANALVITDLEQTSTSSAEKAPIRALITKTAK